MSLRMLMVTAVTFSAASAQADVILSESFNDVASLAGRGWVLTNQSTPLGSTGWFQGDATILTSQSGSAESYVAANFNNSAAGGVINNWLISPMFSTAVAGTISFWLRGAADAGYIDTLAYGFGAGSSASIASFTSTTTMVAPATWTAYSVSYAAQGAGSVGRFAINYFGSADRADYIGMDTFAVTNAVPEPSSWALMALGLAGAVGLARRRQAGTASH